MKRVLSVFLIYIFVNCTPIIIEDDMAVSVPDTNTFSLTDVLAAVEDHAGDIANNLLACFSYANSTYFDPGYNNSSYAPANSMKRFRNYGPDNASKEIFVPEGFSPNGDGVHDYFEVLNLEYYSIHKMSIFAPPGGFSYGGGFVSGGTKLYEKINNYHLYPWNGTYNGYNCPEMNYVWTLEIDGSAYDNGTVMIAR